MPTSAQQGSTSDQFTKRPTHAGGVVYRTIGDRREYLLVRARKRKGAWVFPKGHIEPGESAEQAALREVKEEAGVRATIAAPLGRLVTSSESVEMFLMRLENSEKLPAERECAWLALEQALIALAFDESRQLLRLADRLGGVAS